MQAQSLEDRHKRALEVGVAFVKDFFTKLSKDPAAAAALYMKDSVLYDLKGTYEGHDSIKEYVERLAGGYKFSFDTVLAQASAGTSVLLTLQGVQLTRQETTRFSRTMLLVQRPSDKKYCVQNDVMLEMHQESNEIPSSKPTASRPATSPDTAKTKAGNGKDAAPAPASAAAPEPTPTPSTGFSWADKLKAGGVSSPATSASVQRVVGGALLESDGQPKKPAEKKEVPKKKEEVRRGGAEAPKPAAGKNQYPAEKFQYDALYVTNLPDDMTEAEFDKLFTKYGKIIGKTFKQGAYCFVDFEDKTSVQAACSDKILFRGVRLTVQERKSPEQRAEEKARKEEQEKRARGTGARR